MDRMSISALHIGSLPVNCRCSSGRARNPPLPQNLPLIHRLDTRAHCCP
jgi:hypothetical protein